MLPHLRSADFDGAARGRAREGRRGGDRRSTPRQLAAGAPGQRRPRARRRAGRRSSASSGWAFFNWRRFGKDPVYLDDPSILMPAPPPDLTAASGRDGHGRRDVAAGADHGDARPRQSRGLIAFREETRAPGLGDEGRHRRRAGRRRRRSEAQRARNARRPTGPAEEVALDELRRSATATTGYITPDDLPKFGSHVAEFDAALEEPRRRPRAGSARSRARSSRAGPAAASWPSSAGSSPIVAGFNIPISGLTLIGGAAIAGGDRHPHRSPGRCRRSRCPGAMIRAMLEAYRRTLQKTMAQARSMQQVVDEAGLDWLDTPDQAVVWGTALGLQDEIEGVLERSLEDVKRGTDERRRRPTSRPGTRVERNAVRGSARRGGSGGGLFSDSGDPGLRRDDVRARDDRELAVVVGRRRRRRVQRRVVRRWRRRLRRRVLAGSGT